MALTVPNDDVSATLNDASRWSSYGDQYVTEYIPEIAGSPTYGFLPSNFRSFTAGADAVAGVVDELFTTECGTDGLGSYGAIQSFRTIRYKSGAGAGVRFGAYFDTPQALTWRGAGLLNIGDEISFGYNGLDFGVWHRHGGRAEIQELQITTPASGSETASVTIDGTLYSIPITSGTVQFNAYEIADYLDANIVGWEVEQLDDTVIIAASSDGNKTNTFSFSSTGACVASFTEIKAGVSKVSDFVAMENWNGRVPAGFDPSKGNSYQITYKDGFGNIDFFIEDSHNNKFILCHTIEWTNKNTTVNLHNPSLRAGCYATSIGSTTNVKTFMSDISAFTHGSLEPTRNPRGVFNTKNVGTTFNNILTLRNSRVYNGHINQVEIEPRFITLTNDGTKAAIFELRTNVTLGGTTNYQAVGSNLVSELDTSGTTVTGGRFIATFTVGRQSSIPVDLSSFKIAIPPTLSFTIAGKMDSGSASDLSASLTYYENV